MKAAAASNSFLGLGLVFCLTFLGFWALSEDPFMVEFTGKKNGIANTQEAEAGITPGALEQVAIEYAEAYQAGKCGTIIDLTAWMQDRLAYAQEVQDLSYDAVRDELCVFASTRNPAGNRLSEAGIEDQYIFRPGSVIEFLGSDEGNRSLDEPVASRAWLHVTYDVERGAPMDAAGNTIGAITVGANVSEGGKVLKANVIGNLEIVFETITLDSGV